MTAVTNFTYTRILVHLVYILRAGHGRKTTIVFLGFRVCINFLFYGIIITSGHSPDECPTVHETYDITVIDDVPSRIPNFKESSKFGVERLTALMRLIFSSLELALGKRLLP